MSDILRLRSWLPEKRSVEAFQTGAFGMVGVAALFAVLFLVIEALVIPQDSENDWMWLIRAGNSFSSIFLGFTLSTWWAEKRRGDTQRVEAIRIDDQIEEDIQRVAGHWQQTIHSLNTLIGPEMNAEFFKASRYLLGAQQNYVQHRLQEMALKIDQSGYDSQPFLKEKIQRFSAMKSRVIAIVRDMPTATDTDQLVQLFTTLGPIQIDGAPVAGGMGVDEPGDAAPKAPPGGTAPKAPPGDAAPKRS